MLNRAGRMPSRFKLCLLGDSGVGKSCIATRFIHDDFDGFMEPTIGAAFMKRQIEVSLPGSNAAASKVTVDFDIWDTAGQERYRSIAPMYYRGARAAVVVFDLTSKQSFTSARTWVSELNRYGETNILIALAGNKVDLVESEEDRHVPQRDVDAFVTEKGILFFETSAKTGQNVDVMFRVIGQQLALQRKQERAKEAGGGGEEGAEIVAPGTTITAATDSCIGASC